ncbi:MAG: class I SAM-dependent methyltransferase [Promethearchaeota archaeon]|jgi:SAM-dependent methyltransferase
MGKDKKKAYWEKRYSSEGKIWGEGPSESAKHALKLFREYGITSILVPGAGYGRHTKFFSNYNYKVTGIEISNNAIEIGRRFDPISRFINRSVMEIETLEDEFDAIFCFNLLHLFLQGKRRNFLKKCFTQLHNEGFVFFTVFSETESTFGKGKMVEKNTFESKPGRPTHYFTKDDLVSQFHEYDILEEGIIKEPENHGEKGNHHHKLRYIFAQKIN